ncbi:trypsin-like peptidase domain-containing protein [Teredinibacter turnerae]|uniref:trypsin-like peptidase domain-containing protein n=1 Tax=Teredinibacter turnerae TaxID=2426 RepID=UPI000370BA60|nr:trypsin-like peptidase domain-containing protein [Teredinibacter turnerae]
MRAASFFRFVCVLTVALAIHVNAASYNLPDFRPLIEKTSPAVVKINTTTKARQSEIELPPGHQIPDIFRHLLEPRDLPRREMHSMGSGFFISADGYLLTNNHVVEDADQILVRLVDRREYKAIVIGRDPRSDLALLKVDEEKLPYLELAAKDDIQIGEWVVAIGSPFGLDFSASAGIVSAIGRSIPTERNENYVPFIQTDVAINPGNSGGPLFNLDGKVVGVNSQIYTRSGGSIGLSFAIPSSVALNVVSQLKEKGRVDRGWLGVVIQEVDKDLADSFGLKKPAGALVAQLEPTGPAALSGLQVGDIILRFDNQDILASGDLPHAVGATPPDTEVPVLVMRKGKRKTLEVKVGRLSGHESDAPAKVLADGNIATDRLGLVVEPVDATVEEKWHLAGGVLVTQVDPQGAAADAGISPGDVIAQLGFEQIVSVADYTRVMKALPADDLVPIRFFRDGSPTFRTIRIE